MIRGLIGFITLFPFFLLQCGQPEEPAQKDSSYIPIENSYAQCFRILRNEGEYKLQILSPSDSQKVQQEIDVTSSVSTAKDIKPFPISGLRKVIVISTTYLSFIDALGESSSIVGVSDAKLIYSSGIQELVETGKITEVGGDHALNYEKIIELNADAIFFYDFGPSTAAVISRLESLNQRVVRISEFRELHPLGKAEWIRFFGALFGKLEMADSIFKNVELEYNKLLELTSEVDERPTVFTGLPWKGEWYQPGGKSFQATLFRHAGARYLWEEDEHDSGITIDREIVIDKAMDADFWLHPSNTINLKEISEQDQRFEKFRSFGLGKVYNNNLRVNKDMGNDYWESGLLNPHLILQDLILIFHPELKMDKSLNYYRKLE